MLHRVKKKKNGLKITQIRALFFYLLINKRNPNGSDSVYCANGGVGETRTLAPVTRSTSLAGKPLHQLGYYSR